MVLAQSHRTDRWDVQVVQEIHPNKGCHIGSGTNQGVQALIQQPRRATNWALVVLQQNKHSASDPEGCVAQVIVKLLSRRRC